MDNKTTSKTKPALIALIICAGIVIVGVIAFFQYQRSVVAQRIVEEVKIETTENSEDAEEEVAQITEDPIEENPEEPVEPELAETEESGMLYTVEPTVMYKLPDENQDAYVYLPMGCEVEVLAKTENGYTKVRYGLKKGYLKNELLTAETPEIPEKEDDEQTAEAQQAEEKTTTGDAATPATSTPAPTAEQQAAIAAQQEAAAAANAPAAPVTAADATFDAMWGGDIGWDGSTSEDLGGAEFN